MSAPEDVCDLCAWRLFTTCNDDHEKDGSTELFATVFMLVNLLLHPSSSDNRNCATTEVHDLQLLSDNHQCWQVVL